MNIGHFHIVGAVVATLFWYLLGPLLARVPTLSTGGSRLRYEWYHSLAYPIVSCLAIVAVIAEGAIHPHQIVATDVAAFIASAQVGFFAAGVLLALSTDFPLVRASAVHHLVSIAIYTALLVQERLPVMLLWVMVVQLTGVVFHPLRVLKQTPSVSPRTVRIVENIHLAVFIVLRLIVYTLATGVFLWADHRSPLFDSLWWEMAKWSCLCTYVVLHITWASHLIGRPAMGTTARAQGT